MATCDIIQLMEMEQEMKNTGVDIYCEEPHVYCKVFEDNSGDFEITRLLKMRPRTKHINVCYHHFREYVRKGIIKIFPIDTMEQVADIFTKPLVQNTFVKL